jgi:hypothetical protein
MTTNITREQLINLINQLADQQGSWNGAGKYGSTNHSLVIQLFDDASGRVYIVQEIDNADGHQQCEFDNAEELADYLVENFEALESVE